MYCTDLIPNTLYRKLIKFVLKKGVGGGGGVGRTTLPFLPPFPSLEKLLPMLLIYLQIIMCANRNRE